MSFGRVIDRLPAAAAVPLRAKFGDRDPEVDVLDRYVRPGVVVWDVGAHKGAYTWHLARLVGRTGHVHAFEPQPDLAHRLKHWAPSNVSVHSIALSDKTHTASLRVPVWGGALMQGHGTLESTRPDSNDRDVTIRTGLGDSFDHAPAFIKVDIEGHELSMLHGSARTLASSRAVLLMEIDYRHEHELGRRRDLLRWLEEHQYTAHYVAGGEITKYGHLNPDADPNASLRLERYIYNWFLLPV